MLAAPMFPTHWRWNATIALAVRRNMNGKKVPAIFQRSDAEDLMAVVFPDQLACQENLAGEREVPDHPLVNQTVDDCLNDVMDIDGLTAVLKKIEEDKIHLSTPDGDKVIDNDFVLAMTGYQPDFSFLTKLGIELGDDENKTPVHDPESMESNVEGIYLAGVICGGLKTNKWFIENSRDHASVIFSNIN